MMRREAFASNESENHSEEIRALQIRQKVTEERLDKVHEVTDLLEQQVGVNVKRLDKHAQSIKSNSNNVKNIMKTLQEMKLHHETQANRTNEQHDTIMAEIRKSNEMKLKV